MKEIILKQMIDIVDNTMSFSKADFYKCDLHTLSSIDEKQPFMWNVRRGATTLLTMDAQTEMERLANSEAYRFSFMNMPYCYADNFVDIAACDGKVFYYDGETLKELPLNQVKEYVRDIYHPTIKKMIDYVNRYFAKKDGGYKKKMAVRFACQSDWRKVLSIARTSKGTALLRTLRHFRHYQRLARDQYIVVRADFIDNSFVFAEIINGENKMNGGIVYDGGHWTIHT